MYNLALVTAEAGLIDLMKWDERKMSTEFCNTMFSLGLRPLIDKPSRITKDSATLIDNIFTNTQRQVTSGLLISDVSDHLPVFVVVHNLIAKCSVDKSEPPCKLMRLRTPERIEALKIDLSNYNWDEVYVDDPEIAFDVFLSAFLKLYNKHCPIKMCKAKDQFKGKPWMTKGLQKACNKKNQLYKKFLQQRTSDSEGKA